MLRPLRDDADEAAWREVYDLTIETWLDAPDAEGSDEELPDSMFRGFLPEPSYVLIGRLDGRLVADGRDRHGVRKDEALSTFFTGVRAGGARCWVVDRTEGPARTDHARPAGTTASSPRTWSRTRRSWRPTTGSASASCLATTPLGGRSVCRTGLSTHLPLTGDRRIPHKNSEHSRRGCPRQRSATMQEPRTSKSRRTLVRSPQAAEHGPSRDRGRSADVCGGRTVRWLRHLALGNSHAPLGSNLPLGSASEPGAWQRRRRWQGIQRSIWSGLRGSSWHGRQRVHVGLHHVDRGGSGGDRRRGVRHDVPERDQLDVGECHHNGRRLSSCSARPVERPSRQPRSSCNRLTPVEPRHPRRQE